MPSFFWITNLFILDTAAWTACLRQYHKEGTSSRSFKVKLCHAGLELGWVPWPTKNTPCLWAFRFFFPVFFHDNVSDFPGLPFTFWQLLWLRLHPFCGKHNIFSIIISTVMRTAKWNCCFITTIHIKSTLTLIFF